jgi:excisionase family DNA binding protein
MKAELRLREIAALEGVSLRQVQRWVRKGELCATVIRGRERLVKREDYLAFVGKVEATAQQGENLPQAAPEPSGAKSPLIPAPEPSAPGAERPAIFRPAMAGGPLTNCPHPCSGNMPSPETVREFTEREARNLIQSFTGAKDNDDHFDI